MPDIFKPPTESPTAQTINTSVQESNLPSYLPREFSTKYPSPTQVSLFSSFCLHPRGLQFRNQEEDEHIVLFLRRHFIVNIPWIFAMFLFMLFPLFAITLLKFSELQLFEIPPRMIFVLLAFYYLVVLTYALINFIVWFYHVGIVTQKRLLDLDVYNILSHHLAECEFRDVVDVSYAQRGFFQSYFDYGDVPIQTTAIKMNFEFEASPKPAVVSDIITDLRPKGGRHG